MDYDKILICVADYRSKLEMMNQLLDLGVRKEHIGYIEEYEPNYLDDSIEVIDKDTVIVRAGNLAVKCSNDIEYMIAEEVLMGEEYGFHGTEEYFVIDIGMNIGCATLYFAGKDYVTAVYGFEPCKGVYNKAIDNIAMNCNHPNICNKITTYNIGLGGSNCREDYIAHNGEGESAGVKKIQDGAVVGPDDHIIELEIKQSSSVLREIFTRHSEKCLVKMDCEGAEYEIFEDLISSGLINNINVIIMEWHVGKYRQLEELLRKAGFKYILDKKHSDYGKCYAWK